MAGKKTTAAKTTPHPNTVDAFLTKLDHPLKAEIMAVRTLILGVDKRIQESVKWNAPSFYIEEHFATFKLRPLETLQVVLHTGAKVKSNRRAFDIDDPSGLLKWVAQDRALITLTNLQEIRTHKAALTTIVKQWIAQM